MRLRKPKGTLGSGTRARQPAAASPRPATQPLSRGVVGIRQEFALSHRVDDPVLKF